jgi:hypothetical protein
VSSNVSWVIAVICGVSGHNSCALWVGIAAAVFGLLDVLTTWRSEALREQRERPRLLTYDKHRRLRELLGAGPKGTFVLVALDTDDEAWDFAWALQDALTASGWTATSDVQRGRFGRMNRLGVQFNPHATKREDSNVLALRTALIEVLGEFASESVSQGPQDVIVFVGSKPRR